MSATFLTPLYLLSLAKSSHASLAFTMAKGQVPTMLELQRKWLKENDMPMWLANEQFLICVVLFLLTVVFYYRANQSTSKTVQLDQQPVASKPVAAAATATATPKKVPCTPIRTDRSMGRSDSQRSSTSTPRSRKRWHTHHYIEETIITFTDKETFGIRLKGPEKAGGGHEVYGCHVVAFTSQERKPKCENIQIDMSLVEINGKDVTNESIDTVREHLQERPITTRWILFDHIDQCPDTPDLHL